MSDFISSRSNLEASLDINHVKEWKFRSYLMQENPQMLSYQIPLEYLDRGSAQEWQESGELGVIGAISQCALKRALLQL